MEASFVDLRTKSASIIEALRRNERVTVLYRGRPAAIMQPIGDSPGAAVDAARDHAAFGMWAHRDELKDVAAHVRRLRQRRLDAR